MERRSHNWEINFSMPQGSILEPVLYLVCTADLPVAMGSTIATYADNIAVLVAHNSHIEAHHGDYRKVSITSRDGLKNGESKSTKQNQYRWHLLPEERRILQ